MVIMDTPENQVNCHGTETLPVEFTTTITDGEMTYAWVNDTPEIGLAEAGEGNIPAFTAVNYTLATLVATVTVTPTYHNNGLDCVGDPITFTYTVNPMVIMDTPENQVNCHGTETLPVEFTTTLTDGEVTYTWVNDMPEIGLAAEGEGNIPAFIAVNTTLAAVTATVTVTPTYTNNGISCVGEPITFTYTVNPEVIMDTPANQVYCYGETTEPIVFTTTLEDGEMTYNWVATALGQSITGVGDIPATLLVHQYPIFMSVVVTITVTPTYTNNGISCVGEPVSFTITVNPEVLMNTPADQVVCHNAETEAVVFTTPVLDGTMTYAWTNDTPEIGLAEAGEGDIPAFIATNTTLATLVATVTVTPTYHNNGRDCVGDPITFTYTVNPQVIMDTPADQVNCHGTETLPVEFTTTLTDGEVTYTWVNDMPEIGLAAEGEGNIPAFIAVNTTLAAVTATVTVTPTYTNNGISCVGEPITFTYTVNPEVIMDTPANQVYCYGETTEPIVFTTTLEDGEMTYNWVATALGQSITGVGDIPATLLVHQYPIFMSVVVTITVTPTYTNNGISCVGEPVSFTITLNPQVVMNTPEDQVVCHGAETEAVVFGTPILDGTMTYNWVNDTPEIGLAEAGEGNIPAFMAVNTTLATLVATVTVTPTYTNNGRECVGDPITFTYTVNPQVVMNTPADEFYCNGSLTNGTIFTSDIADGTVTYAWTNDNPAIGLAEAGEGNIESFTALNSTDDILVANITVVPTYTNNGISCVGDAVTYAISVYPTAVMNTVADQTIYSREYTEDIIFSTNVAYGVTYTWVNDNPAIGLAASGEGNIPSFMGAAPITENQVANITVTPTFTYGDLSCVGVPTTFTITVIPTYLVVTLPAVNGTLTDNARVAANGDHYAPAGEVITMTAVPAAGYMLEYVTATMLDNILVVVPVEDDQFFTMPAFDVQVSASFIGEDNLLIKPGTLDLGYRPINAWMYSKFFSIKNNTNHDFSLNHVDVNDHTFFEMDPLNLPITIEPNGLEYLGVNTNYKIVNPGIYTSLVAMTATRAAYVRRVVATAYTPVTPDVWELAANVTSYPYISTQTTKGVLYDNYQLPGNTPDGYDGVYKLVFDHDVILDAAVTAGANPKVVVYDEDFRQVGGPHINNYHGASETVQNEAIIGNGTTTSNYMPYYTFYNYSLSQMLYTADELAAAGLRAGVINSIEFKVAVPQNRVRDGISIWMANVTAEAVSSPIMSTANMPLVYTGSTTMVPDWNAFEFNGDSFTWDGTSNILVTFVMNHGSYTGSPHPQWSCHNPGFPATAYTYRDSAPYYPATDAITATVSSALRPDTKFNGGTYNLDGGVVMGDDPLVDLPLFDGTYYLVASSTSDDSYTVEINVDDMPLPLEPSPIYPAMGAQGIESPVTFQWQFGEYTHEYQMLLGTTYGYQEVVVDWTSNLNEFFNAGQLLNNTIYYWRINERNSSGTTYGPLWIFTTELNVPENLTAEDYTIFEGENAVLNWTPVLDRSHRGYNVYQDGVKINSTPVVASTYTVSGLTYNMTGYEYMVTAVYDEGESDYSNAITIQVSGNGTISGHVYEQDGTTGIAGATVMVAGTDEFNDAQSYQFTTNASGAYSGSVRAGQYAAMATKDGYQNAYYPDVVGITYQMTTSDIDIIMNETYDPVSLVIAEEVDDTDVHVYWMWEVPFSGFFLDFADGQTPEGWTLEGNWQIGNTCVSSWGFFGGTLPNPPFMYINSDDAGSGVTVSGNFTSPVIDAQYISALTLEFDHFADASSGDVCEIQVSTDGNSWTTVQAYTGQDHGSWTAPEHATIDLSNYLVPTLQIRFHYTDNGSWLYGWAVDNISLTGERSGDRAFDHFKVYRRPMSDLEDISLLASEITVYEYHDVSWINTPDGVYQWGVSANYEGNRGESEIVWSNVLDKNMIANVNLFVRTNSNDPVTGAVVTMTNVSEPDLNLAYNVTLDETGTYTWEEFRKGEYEVNITLDGFLPFSTTESIWSNTDLTYILEENVANIDGLYTSATGWAMFGSMSSPVVPPIGGGTEFSVDFENGLPEGWTVVDANNDGWTWCLTSAIPTTWTYYASLTLDWYHGGTNAICSGSYINGVGAIHPDEYLISSEVSFVNGSQISFWVAATDASYAADHFGVFVSTSGTNPSDFTSVQEWTLTAKREGMAGGFASRNGEGLRLGTWYNYTVDLSSFAGNNGYIAFRHFNCYDMYIMCLDDIELTTSAKGDRTVRFYNVKLDGVLEGITEHPFFQHNVEGFEEGSTHTTSVQAIYGTGLSEWASFDWVYTPCDEFAGLVDDPTAEWQGSDVVLNWTLPQGTGPVNPTGNTTFTQDFESGLGEWTVVDANNDGYTWCLTSAIPSTWTYYASLTLDWYHNGTNAICSGSYINGVGALNPDEYLISPAVSFVNGSELGFWVAATDASYAADHFGVFVSTTGTAPSDFTSVQEWTLTAKRDGMAGGSASRDGEGLRLGTWYHYTVDLSQFAGNNGYIAFRHFNCYDMYIMCLDDVELTAPAKGERGPWDLMMTFEAPEGGHYGVAYDGNNFYTSNWGYSGCAYNFYKYDLDGNMLEGFNISGSGTLRGITYDGEFFYGVANSSTVYCVDLANHALVNTFTTGYGAMRGITYDPERDGFWVIGNWSGNLTLIDRTGAILQTGPAPTSASDLAYYKDENDVEHIFCFNNGTNDVEDWVIGNASMGGSVFNFSNVPGFASGSSGGCTVGDYNGKVAFIGDIQQSPNLIGVYELREGSVTPPVPPVVGDIIGVEIFRDGEWIAEVYAPTETYTDINPNDPGYYEIRVIHDGLQSDYTYYAMSCPEVAIMGTPSCTAPDNLEGEYTWTPNAFGATITWTYGEAPHGDEFFYDFENSSLADWTTIDADGDGNNWMLGSAGMGTGYGHNGSSDMVFSKSYDNNSGALYPDNYLVSRQVTLGGVFSFYACAQDAAWASEHFGVAISTSGNTNAADFTTIQEWTMTAKAGAPTNVTRDGSRTQGNWYLYSVDLSSYAGQTGYIAIRHFNCSDWFYLDVDDISLGASKRAGDPVSFNVYRDGNVIANVPYSGAYDYSYFDQVARGTYDYQVTAVYDNCESEPALTPDLSQDYVSVFVTDVNEMDNTVIVYPNPTKGNVKIEASNMKHITLVSALGQILFDADITGDMYEMSLGQYKAGVYMVRVYTENGVSVKRVTVVD